VIYALTEKNLSNSIFKNNLYQLNDSEIKTHLKPQVVSIQHRVSKFYFKFILHWLIEHNKVCWADTRQKNWKEKAKNFITAVWISI